MDIVSQQCILCDYTELKYGKKKIIPITESSKSNS